MCLIMTVRLSESDAARARDIAAAANSPDAVEVAAAHRLFRRATRDLNICEPAQGCACSMLHDDADWGAPTWRMRLEVLPRLASTLAKIREHTSEPFTFQALWVGDDVSHERQLSVAELRDIVESDRIGTGTRYTIT
jgi:cytochrome c5